MSKPVIAEAWVGMMPSMDGFGRGLSTAIGAAAGTAGTAGGAAYSTAFLAGAKKFILPALAVLTGIGTASGFAQFADAAVQEASTLGESVNAVEVVFGDAADSVLALGENSANSLGLSQKSLNSMAVQFSSFAKTVAGEGGDVATVIDDLTTRGADFASVMDIDVSEALGVFQSALAGETEPIRRYGKDLSAATVEAYALANGISDGTTAMTEAQKVQARYGLLMQVTEEVAGDFANTSGSLANAQRRLNESWVDVQATLGTALIPVAEMFVGILADSMPVLQQVATLVSDLFGALFEGEDAGVAFKEFITAIQPALDEMALVFQDELVPVMRDLGVAFSEDLLPALVDAAPELAKLAALGIELFTVLASDLLPIAIKVAEFIGVEMVSRFAGLSAVIGWSVDVFRSWSTRVGENVETIKNWFSGLPTSLRNALSSVGDAIAAPFKSGFNKIARMWNDTVGGFSFSIPDIPGVPNRGESFSFGKIPYLAEGGIVTRPTLAMLGDNRSATEAVIPLERADEFGFGGNGRQIIHIYGVPDAAGIAPELSRIQYRGAA